MTSKFRQCDTDLVSGYLRQYCLRDTLHIIPSGVKYTCLVLFHGVEFFKHYDNKKIRVSKNGHTITNIFGNHSTTYGSLEIPYNSKGVHTWKIKILKHNGNEWGDIAIGIDESLRKWKSNYFCPQEESKNYGYGSTGIKGDRSGVTKYGTTYSANDLVTMVLDCNNKSLSFSKNKGKSIKAFTVDKTNIGYSFAVCIMGVCDSVSLVSYHWEH
eukprot:354424_1